MSKAARAFVPYKSWGKYYLENYDRLSQNVDVSDRETRRLAVDKELNEKVALVRGDITKLKVDAVVNAANSGLRGGGGVDGAIHNAAGYDKLQNATRRLYPNGCPPGEAVITPGFRLPAKRIIHTVGPMDGSDGTLMSCYHNCLRLCLVEGLRSIAFCCIATGIYGFQNDRAAQIAVATSRAFLEKYGDRFDQIVFCVFMPVDQTHYEEFLNVYFPVEETGGRDSDGKENEENVGVYEIIEKRLKEESENWQIKDVTESEENGDNELKENESKEKVEDQQPLGDRLSPLGAEQSPKAPKKEDRPAPTGEELQGVEIRTSTNEVETESRPAPDGEAAKEQNNSLPMAGLEGGTGAEEAGEEVGKKMDVEGAEGAEKMEVQPNSPKRVKEDESKL